MSRPIAVLRPEPGNRATAAAIEAQGRRAFRLPLFDVTPVDWEPPAAEAFDALILTSANAIRHGGEALNRFRDLPVHAVGDATAEAARRAGFAVAATGSGGAAALIEAARAAGVRRALHLAGRAHTIPAGGIVARIETVYASEPCHIADDSVRALAGAVALVQSARAGARLAALAEHAALDRATVSLAAISVAAARAAGGGWCVVRTAPTPDSVALLDIAFALAD